MKGDIDRLGVIGRDRWWLDDKARKAGGLIVCHQLEESLLGGLRGSASLPERKSWLLPPIWMVFSMEKAPIRSSTLRPYSVTEPKAGVFEAMASRINAKMSVGRRIFYSRF